MYKNVFRPHLLILLFLAGGCNRDTPPTQAMREVVDDTGRTVSVPNDPKRVISLAPSITEVAFAARVGDKLRAVTTVDNYPPEVNSLDRITAFPLDHEGIVAMAPDLVLATDQINSVRDVSALSDVGIPAFFLRFNTASDIFKAVRTVGDLLGSRDLADSAADSLETMWNSLLSDSETASYRPGVLLIAGYDVLYAFGRDSYTSEMIRAAGGRSVTDKLEGQAATLSDEFVLTEQPEIIVGTFGESFDVAQIAAAHPTWNSVPAVATGRVYSMDPDLVSRPGPRIIDGARTIRRWVQAFKNGGK